MSYATFAALLLASGMLAVAPRLTAGARMISLAPLVVAFPLLYVAVSERVAQDRANYYAWYENAAALLHDPTASDKAFTYYLHLLPIGLGPAAFGVIFSLTILAATVAAVHSVGSRVGLRAALLPVLLVMIISDRMFVDLAINTSRSTLAGLILLTALAQPRMVWKALFLALAAGVHGSAMLLLVGLLAISALLIRWPSLVRILFLVAVGMLLYRLVRGSGLIRLPSDLATIDLLANVRNLDRNLSLETRLSGSLFGQIFLALVVPGLVACLRRPVEAGGATLRSGLIDVVRGSPAFLWTYALVTSAAGLVFFPDLLLSQRLFIVPMIVLPMCLRAWEFKTLLLLKSVLLVVILSGQFT